MTIFDLEKEELGDWYSFFNSKIDLISDEGNIEFEVPEEGAAEFQIRSMGPYWDGKRKSKKKEYKMVLNTSSKAMERVGFFPDQSSEEVTKESDDAWDYAITDWRNVYASDADESMIECNRENKLKMVKIPVFLRFITRVFQIMVESTTTHNEDVGKNSLTG